MGMIISHLESIQKSSKKMGGYCWNIFGKGWNHLQKGRNPFTLGPATNLKLAIRFIHKIWLLVRKKIHLQKQKQFGNKDKKVQQIEILNKKIGWMKRRRWWVVRDSKGYYQMI